jgi:biotin carboxyl carrier protein
MKKTLRISFNGKSYEVVAEILGEDGAPAAAAPRSAAAPVVQASASAAPVSTAPSAPRASGAAGEIPSPLAGKVVSIDAPVGAAVKAGQTVITLEAMKMNTVISAPIDGSVAAVHVAPGDSVEEGRLLMTLR